MSSLLIRHEDFEKVKITVSLRNPLSETLIESGKKTIANINVQEKNQLPYHIELLEIREHGMILSVPLNVCSAGHSLVITLTILGLGAMPFEVSIDGIVKESEKTSKAQERISVEIKNNNSVRWRGFCKLFSEKQDSINDLLRRLKGLS